MDFDTARAVITEAPSALLIIDPLGVIMLANRRLSRLFGYGAGELEGQSIEMLLPPAARSTETEPESYQGLASFLAMELGWRKDGTEFPARVESASLKVGARSFVLFDVRDVTEERQGLKVMQFIGDELRNRNQELEQFTYLASHDLKEPLRTITNFADVLQEKLILADDEAAMALRFISDGVERMTRLVDDLLVYSREDVSVPIECVHVAESLEKVKELLHALICERGAQIEHRNLPTLKCRRGDLHQLLQNLCVNAIRHCHPETPPRIVVEGAESDGQWIVSVRDNGIGIPPQYSRRIFEPFFRIQPRSKDDGNGIGLAHCAKIAQRHGGRIWVEPAPDQGSIFRFTLG